MKQEIERIWEERHLLKEDQSLKQKYKEKILEITNSLNRGKISVVHKQATGWEVNEYVKKAILLYFAVTDNQILEVNDQIKSFDKVPLKFTSWTEEDFLVSGFRVVPSATIRKTAYISKNCIIMPSFINVGAFIGEGTLIDSYATIGSCAYIGKNCHISMNVGIGGVLEPIQANPVIIEDNVFIGANCQIVEGVIVEEGSVIALGVNIGASTKIYDRQSKTVSYGRVPAYSVVVPGVINDNDCSLAAAIIVKKVDALTRSKTSLNDLLRD